MNPSSNLFLVGPSGAGKTSIGRRLAEHYGLTFLDLDREIEEHTGVDVATIFEIEGEAGFRHREAAMLAECSGRESVLLATGAGAILDPKAAAGCTSAASWSGCRPASNSNCAACSTTAPGRCWPGSTAASGSMPWPTSATRCTREIAELAITGHNERTQRAFTRCRTRIDDTGNGSEYAAS